MGIWQKIKSKVKSWFGGGGNKKKEAPRPRAVSNNRDARNQTVSSNTRSTFNKRELLNSLKEQKKEEDRVKSAFKAKTVEYKSLSDASKSDRAEKRKGLESTLNADKNKLKEIQDYARKNPQQKKNTATPDPKIDAAKKSRAEMRKKLDAKKQENKEWHEATNNRFNVGEKGISDEERKRRQQNVKMQTYDEKTAVKEAEHQMKWHGKEMSFARGALSGATFGASDLAAKKLTKGEARKAEEVYQRNKSKGWETAGEIAGSLASFGATAGATEKAAAKLTSKVAPKAAEKLAEKQIIKNAATRSVRKAVEKGTIEGATKDLITQVGKEKASKIVSALGNDIVQNLTTGALYDINKASAEHEVGSKEWWKELGTSAAFNTLITGAVAGGSMLTGGKRLVTEAAENLAKDPARRAAAARTQEAVFGRANIAEDLLDRTPVKEGTYGDIRRGILPPNEIEINGTRDINAPLRNATYGREKSIKNAERIESLEATRERLLRNAGADARQENRARLGDLVSVRSKEETRIANINKELDEVSDAISRARKTAPQEEYEALLDRFDELMAERNALEESLGSSAPRNRVRTEPPARQMAETVTEERLPEVDALEPYKRNRLKENPDAVFDESRTARATANEAAEATARNADEATETTARQTAENTTSSTRKEPPKTESAKAAEEAAEDGFEPKMRGRYEHLNEGLKKETEGKVGVRGGIKIAEERASSEERKRILKEAGAEINQRIKEALDNEARGGDFTYKVLTQSQRDDLFFDSYNKVKNADSVSQVVEELEEKMDKILRESEKNPWGMTDQITLQDLSDMLAVEQVYRDAGKPLPPEYEEILTRMVTLQGTQYGQGQRGRYLILKERSPRFRETLLTKDTAKYIDNVFGEDRLKDISRSLDKNHGEKNYLENELKRIANYEKTYAHLPAEERRAAADRAYKELEKDILRNAKMSVWDVINLYRHTGMLSALATGGRNMLGNVSQFLMRELSDKATYFAERGLAKAGGMADDFRPTTVLTYKGKDSAKLANHLTNGTVGKLTKLDDAYFNKFSDKEYAKKMTDVINDAVADMMNIEKYETHAQKGADYAAEKTGEKLIKGLAWLPRKTTKAVNFMLNEPDSWFVETRFRKGLMRYLEANGITDSASLAGKENILEDAIEHAKSQALEDTYKKANRVTTVLERVRQAGLKHDDNMWRNLAKKGAMITLDAELPYLKVPINVGINTVKYSPINIMKSLVDANTAIRRGDAKALSKAAEELSKGLTGTGLATLGFLLNCDEQDSEDSNGFIAKAQDALKEYGVKDYSLKIGDHVYDISNIGQGATQLLMGTRAAEVINENGGAPKGFLDKLDLVRECFAAPVDSIAEMGILDNALGVIDAFSNEGDYEKGFAERVGDAATNIGWDYAGQFIPQPLRGVARGTTSADLDTNVRKSDTTPTKKRLQYNANQFVSAIPVVNEKALPHKVDTHGRLVNERKTNQDKLKAVLNNTVNPVRATKVNIPEVDKIEMSVKNENGEPFKPKGFDSKREYKAKVGTGDNKEVIELTGKEREQVARAAQHSGYDGVNALIKKGMFGDRLGNRAQEILKSIPEDANDEQTRAIIFSTPEWQNADNATRENWLKTYYGEGSSGKGVKRTTNAEAYINVAGNSEGDFRWQNDITSSYQNKYNEAGLAEAGIDKGTWVDIIEACQDTNHKWNEETLKNQDTINSAKKTKAGILSIKGLTPEQRIAAYQVIRGKRNGFGWYDWDGVSGGGGYYRRGYRRRGWRHYGRGGGSKKAPAIKQSDFKASKVTYTDLAKTLKTAGSSGANTAKTASTVKIQPPNVKFKKYEV